MNIVFDCPRCGDELQKMLFNEFKETKDGKEKILTASWRYVCPICKWTSREVSDFETFHVNAGVIGLDTKTSADSNNFIKPNYL